LSSADAVAALVSYLAVPRTEREPIERQAFAQTPLSRELAEQASVLLWEDHAKFIKEARSSEHIARTISQSQLRLRYWFKAFGQKPAKGWSLYISLHGGGNAEPSVNDQQWENQKTLYQPDEGIYLAPRAPTDTWNLWHESHIDAMLERLIANLIVLEQVNPDRVYVMGYSAGGDGVYQLAPRMADYWAAAAAMAGHPNDAKPNSLRNVGFTIHVGALDTAYDRNLVAQEWNAQLDALQAEDASGYAHLVQVHEGKPHWMDLEDAVAVPWMAKFTRNPMPSSVVWLQDDVPHTRFYWLAVDSDQALAKSEVRATCVNQRITLNTTGLSKIKVRLSDGLTNLDERVTIEVNGRELAPSSFPRRISVLAKTLEERGDPRSVFSSELELSLSN
jgi:poly(3-hydroxybutyrate) depolymerase